MWKFIKMLLALEKYVCIAHANDVASHYWRVIWRKSLKINVVDDVARRRPVGFWCQKLKNLSIQNFNLIFIFFIFLHQSPMGRWRYMYFLGDFINVGWIWNIFSFECIWMIVGDFGSYMILIIFGWYYAFYLMFDNFGSYMILGDFWETNLHKCITFFNYYHILSKWKITPKD